MYNTPKSDVRSAKKNYIFTKKTDLINWSCPNIGALRASIVNNPVDL